MLTSFLAFKVRQRSIEAGKITLAEKIIFANSVEPEEMDAILAERKANWKGFTSKYTHGLLKLYSQHAVSAMKGAYME